MSTDLLERKFAEIGVPVCLDLRLSWFNLRVGRNRYGEWINLSPGDGEVLVMDTDRELSQLLLLVRSSDAWGRRTKQKFLCGEDERSLFTVQVYGDRGRPLNRVLEAHEALKPVELRQLDGRTPRYQDPGYLRQGDWFFLPRPDLPRDLPGARRRVRLGAGGGNPHVVDYLRGDERNLFSGWSPFGSSGYAFARGFVRHRDHRTLHLRCWHRVLPNAASRSRGWSVD